MEKHLNRIFESGVSFVIHTDHERNCFYCRVGNKKIFKHNTQKGSYEASCLWIIETVLDKHNQCNFSLYYKKIRNWYSTNMVDIDKMTTAYKLKMIDEYEKKHPGDWLHFRA
jgi:hypothetical protein